MMYPFMTLDDNTEIVHSEMHDDGSVVVCCEKPIHADFKTAYCKIPGYAWYDVENFSSAELDELTRVLKTLGTKPPTTYRMGVKSLTFDDEEQVRDGEYGNALGSPFGRRGAGRRDVGEG